ncbi:hypothetical protein EJ05DRAFT_476073 [Pseudovirgaria hyperparasitica]|uniref:Uncharacterized protein n=1 Tax=Pseudovirgaria hyperparasitica TaxID=470096 RepID=A0A6A6W984_9PEZI|nr:uncharacterized protein EJ05DRAFT_476073 [Pseudovirgaria hyperparasitica]KAF2758759.1 hypothetical protein EJ05DRAFT_476073 [Pseudovirgaria hyperparasitica]
MGSKTVLFFYQDHCSSPNKSVLDKWNAVLGALGCTPHAGGFRGASLQRPPSFGSGPSVCFLHAGFGISAQECTIGFTCRTVSYQTRRWGLANPPSLSIMQ